MSALHDLLERVRTEVASTVLAQRIWARYESAAPREQLAVKILGVVLLFVLALSLVVLPLHRFNTNAIADWRAQQDTLIWMQSNRGAIGSDTQKPRAAGDTVLALANQSARNLGVTIKRYEPSGQGLNIWFEQVPFTQVVKWLEVLQRDYGVIAIEFSASKRDEPGMVDVRVTLKG